jgi:hypothetical protein
VPLVADSVHSLLLCLTLKLTLVSRTFNRRGNHELTTPTFVWMCQKSQTVSKHMPLLDAICGRVCQVAQSACTSPVACTFTSIMCHPGSTPPSSCLIDTVLACCCQCGESIFFCARPDTLNDTRCHKCRLTRKVLTLDTMLRNSGAKSPRTPSLISLPSFAP